MRNFACWIALVVACSLFASPASAGMILDEYLFSGVTTDASAQAVVGSIYFYGDTPVAATTAKSSTYGPTSADPVLSFIVLGATSAEFYASSYDASDFLTVQHGAGVADVLRFDIAGFALTLTKNAGGVFGDTSLGFGNSLTRSEFDTATLQATFNGTSYNINVTQFYSPIPEPASALMVSMAGVMGMGWRYRSANRRPRV